MKIIGITGGVGAGKSTVLNYLEKHLSACVIQADQVGHQVMEPGGRCYAQVISLFGKNIVKNDNTIDRKACLLYTSQNLPEWQTYVRPGQHEEPPH